MKEMAFRAALINRRLEAEDGQTTMVCTTPSGAFPVAAAVEMNRRLYLVPPDGAPVDMTGQRFSLTVS